MWEEQIPNPSDQQISTKISLSFCARGLVAQPTVNSFIVVSLCEGKKETHRILKTKIYRDQVNPNYLQSVVIDFIFEVRQKLLIEVYNEIKNPILIGKVQTSVGEVYGSLQDGLVAKISKYDKLDKGKLIIRCEKAGRQKKKIFQTQISANGLPNLGGWWKTGSTNPFFRIFRKIKQENITIYESQVIPSSTSPSWNSFKITEKKLCDNDDQLEIIVRFYSSSKEANNPLIGESSFTLSQLAETKEFKILNEKGGKSGTMKFNELERRQVHSFPNFLDKGLKISLTTCIDFTSSNGCITSPSSYHYHNSQKKSHYEEAMDEVLNILLDYDQEKLVPCYGFGALVNHPCYSSQRKVSHCFPLNANKKNPRIFGKENIIKEYKEIIHHLKFSAPSKFGQLLKNVMEVCYEFQESKIKTEYMILFILTDGQIHDKPEVIDLLIKCNRLPLSIIIVGVGDGNFEHMRQLDDDGMQMVDSKGNKTERDLVQFVEFRQFKNDGVELARQILFELPRQIQEYFYLVGLTPKDIVPKELSPEEMQYMKFQEEKMESKNLQEQYQF